MSNEEFLAEFKKLVDEYLEGDSHLEFEEAVVSFSWWVKGKKEPEPVKKQQKKKGKK